MEQEKDKRRSFLKQILAGSAVVVGAAAVVKPAKAKMNAASVSEDEVLYSKSESFEKYYKRIRS